MMDSGRKIFLAGGLYHGPGILRDPFDSLQKILLDLKTLKSPRLNWRQFERDLKQGLWFCSNSPMGYGLGSSGAVCAALYTRYASKKASDLAILKKELAKGVRSIPLPNFALW